MFQKILAGSVAVAALVASASAQSDMLVVGEKAPNLDQVTWIQGEPVSSWQPGEVYVLDFWAPWCGPCVASMPHVNEMHKELKDEGVTIIGVSIWPTDSMTPTDEFVRTHVVDEESGEKILYTIAEDLKPEGQRAGPTANAFMQATGSNGIPTVMIIDQEGRLAWVGHPMNSQFDSTLREVVAGSYDIEAAAAKARVAAEARAKAEPYMRAVNEAASNGDWDTVIENLDKLIEMGHNPSQMITTKVRILALQMGDSQRAFAAADEAIRGPLKDDANGLNSLSWFLVSSEQLENPDYQVALRGAKRANEISGGNDANILDTLAHAYYKTGDREKAIEVQKKAVENAPNKEAREALAATLEKFERGEQN